METNFKRLLSGSGLIARKLRPNALEPVTRLRDNGWEVIGYIERKYIPLWYRCATTEDSDALLKLLDNARKGDVARKLASHG